MPSSSTLTVFVLAALALLLIPGPAVLYIVAGGSRRGERRRSSRRWASRPEAWSTSWRRCLGCRRLVLSSAVAFSVVKYLGAAYLVYLGVRTLRSRDAAGADKLPPAQRAQRIFAQGVLVSALNPKTALFFLAFLPQFVDPDRGAVAGQILILGGVFISLAVCTDGLYALSSGTLGGWLRHNLGFLRAQRLFAGTVYIGLGLTTALTGSDRK